MKKKRSAGKVKASPIPSSARREAIVILRALALLNFHALTTCRENSFYGQYRRWLVARGDMKKDEHGWMLNGFRLRPLPRRGAGRRK